MLIAHPIEGVPEQQGIGEVSERDANLLAANNETYDVSGAEEFSQEKERGVGVSEAKKLRIYHAFQITHQAEIKLVTSETPEEKKQNKKDLISALQAEQEKLITLKEEGVNDEKLLERLAYVENKMMKVESEEENETMA
jgi:hypothetical protein